MEKLRGIIERITYTNFDTGYSVLKLKCKGYLDLVTVVGNISAVNVGSVLTIKGVWSSNPKYGKQFNVEEWEESLPATLLGMEKYLGSGLIKGIGPVYAQKIINYFKEDTFKIMEECPERMSEISGIGPKKIETIKKSWHDQKEIKNIMLFLQNFGISTAFGARIYKTYGQESISVLEENPYKMADDIWGIGFKTADNLAMKLGIDKESDIRCRSGIFYVLSKFSENGDCFAYYEKLLEVSQEILEIQLENIKRVLEDSILKQELFRDGEAIYLPPFYFAEVGVAKKIKNILRASKNKKIDRCEKIINEFQTEKNFLFEKIQKEALIISAKSKIMVLTGGPGTGKTTTTQGIISIFQKNGLDVLLAAPTGRAAKRITETTGLEAKTIHRLLEYKPPEGYKKNEENKLEGDVLILDESSMIDLLLMYNLLKAVPDHMILIIVGDSDQLPSVGPGSILHDIIQSGVIPVVKLQEIFRQGQGSRIITNAHKINRGENPDLSGGKESDFFFLETTTNEETLEKIIDYTTNRIPKYYKLDPMYDIQILTPMQRGDTGAQNLNLVLQEKLNPSKEFLKRGGTEYRLNDKVMQIRNNYDKEVYNGDVGVISKLNIDEKTIIVNYDGKEIEYDILELDELVLSYGTTIHKSQGSEYPVVIIPLSFSHYVMLQRNLIYTGITRAKKLLVLVGDKKALFYGIKNNTTKDRNSLLIKRLRGE